MRSKGQSSTIFMFILATVIIGIIAIMGYVGINKLTDSASEAARADLYKQIDADIQDIRRQRLSSQIKTYRFAPPIERVCFRSYNENGNSLPAAVRLARSNNHTVFFLDQSGLLIHSMDTGPISPYFFESSSGTFQQTDSFCTTRTQIEIRLTGQGSTTRVEEVQ